MIVLLGWGFYRSGSCGLQKICLSLTSPITHFSLFQLNLTWLLVSCGVFYKHVFCAQTSLVKNKKECLASSSRHFSQVHMCFFFFVFLLNKRVVLLLVWEPSLTWLCWNPGCLNKAHSSFPEGVCSIEKSKEANSMSEPEAEGAQHTAMVSGGRGLAWLISSLPQLNEEI